jgi:rubrerythrin
MNVEQAITTALEYEARVHKTYSDALRASKTPVARRIFKTLCDEEAEHVRFLKDRLDDWRTRGVVTTPMLDSVLVPKDVIEKGVETLRENLESNGAKGRDTELEHLRKALAVERETSAFYERMVGELDGDGKRLFERFVEIEQGHLALVQAEINCVTGSGFWFDTAEFSLEMG